MKSVSFFIQLNQLNIGDGHILSVSKAEYQNKEGKEEPKTVEQMYQELINLLPLLRNTEMYRSLFQASLPVELPIDEHPMIFIWNAYDPSEPEEELREIEV